MNNKSTLDGVSSLAHSKLEAFGGDLSLLPEELKIFIVVETTQALIDNGGLEYFFYSDFPNTPPYRFFSDAYRQTGAFSAAKIIDDAAQVFGVNNPEQNLKVRRAYIDSQEGIDVPPSELAKLSDSICGDESIWILLEKYAEKIGTKEE